MKKLLSILITIAIVICSILTFTGCSNSHKNIDVALITTGYGVKSDGYDKITWDGIKSYCKKNKLKSNYFDTKLSDDNTLSIEAIRKSVEDAVDANAKYIVLPGEDFAVSAYKVAPNYPDVNFILINAIPHSEEDNVMRIQKNVMCVSFDALSVGYLNGYMDVANGNDVLGYICEFNSTNSGDYGSGYVKGASDAANELNIDAILNYADYNAVNLSYNYAIKLVPHYKNIETEKFEFTLNASVDEFSKTFVVVQDGEGTGTYKAGDVVTISADDKKDGNDFEYWTCEDYYGNEISLDFSNANSASTTFTMIDRFPSLISKMAQDGAKSIYSGGNSRVVSMFKNSGVTDVNLGCELFYDDVKPQIILDYGKAVELALDDYKGGSFLQAGCANHCITSYVYSTIKDDKEYNKTYDKIYKNLASNKVEMIHVQSGGDIRKAVKTDKLKLNYMINE